MVPPLRERRQDIPLLVNQFLSQFATRQSHAHVDLCRPEAMNTLIAYSWPGNVRELENAMERLVVTLQGNTIESEHLPAGNPRQQRRSRAETEAGTAPHRLPTICTNE
jgi:two-component system response regulator HydG